MTAISNPNQLQLEVQDMHPHSNRRRRRADYGGFTGWYWGFYEKYGAMVQLVFGAILIPIAIVVAVTAIQLRDTTQDVARAQVATFESRRISAFRSCMSTEQLKAEVLLVLKSRGADSNLPRLNGRRVFQPLDESVTIQEACTKFAQERVPRDSKP